jgi:hypothetical protein
MLSQFQNTIPKRKDLKHECPFLKKREKKLRGFWSKKEKQDKNAKATDQKNRKQQKN